MPDANGSGALSWAVEDDGSGVAPNANTLADSLTITVNPINDGPTANPVFVVAKAGENTPVILTGSDIETPTSLTFAIVNGPARGTLAGFNPATGTVTYTPDADQAARTASPTPSPGAGGATSAPATVSIVLGAEADLAVAVDDHPRHPAGCVRGNADLHDHGDQHRSQRSIGSGPGRDSCRRPSTLHRSGWMAWPGRRSTGP